MFTFQFSRRYTLTCLISLVFLLTGCINSSSNDDQDNTDATGEDVIIRMLLLDSVSGTPIGGDVASLDIQVTIKGEALDHVTSQDGVITNTLTPDQGVFEFSIKDLVPSSEDPIEFKMITKVDGYMSANSSFLVEQDGISEFSIEMLNVDVGITPPGISQVEATGEANAEAGVVETINVVAGSPNETGGSASVSIPEGVHISTADGDPLVGDLTVSTIFFNNTTDSALAAFPGGFEVTNLVDQTGVEQEGIPIVAGFTRIEITDTEGNKAKTFDSPISITIQVPSDALNPETGNTIQLGDNWPIWSYDEDTEKWSEEGFGTASGPENGYFTVSFEASHLSVYSIMWIGDYCKRSRELLVEGNPSSLPVNFEITSDGYQKSFQYSGSSIRFSYVPGKTPVTIKALYADTEILSAEDVNLCIPSSLPLSLDFSKVNTTVVELTVRDGDENPVADKMIIIRNTDSGSTIFPGRTDENGLLVVENLLVAGNYNVQVIFGETLYGGKRVPIPIIQKTFTLEDLETNTIEMALPSLTTLTVQVTSSNNNAGNLPIYIKREEGAYTKVGYTDSVGKLIIPHPFFVDDVYSVRVNLALAQYTEETAPLEKDTHTVELKLPDILELTVSASSSSNEPVKGAQVWLREASETTQNTWHSLGVTGSNGQTTLSGLIGNILYDVKIYFSESERSIVDKILLTSENHALAFLDVPVVPLYVVVINDDGEPVEGLPVYITKSVSPKNQGKTDSNGALTIQNMFIGDSYNLFLDLPYDEAHLEFSSDAMKETGNELQLDVALRDLEVTVTDYTGQPVYGNQGEVSLVVLHDPLVYHPYRSIRTHDRDSHLPIGQTSEESSLTFGPLRKGETYTLVGGNRSWLSSIQEVKIATAYPNTVNIQLPQPDKSLFTLEEVTMANESLTPEPIIDDMFRATLNDVSVANTETFSIGVKLGVNQVGVSANTIENARVIMNIGTASNQNNISITLDPVALSGKETVSIDSLPSQISANIGYHTQLTMSSADIITTDGNLIVFYPQKFYEEVRNLNRLLDDPISNQAFDYSVSIITPNMPQVANSWVEWTEGSILLPPSPDFEINTISGKAVTD